MSFVDAHDFPVDRFGFRSRGTRWPVGGTGCDTPPTAQVVRYA